MNDFSDLNGNPMNLIPGNGHKRHQRQGKVKSLDRFSMSMNVSRKKLKRPFWTGPEISEVQETTERVELSWRMSWAEFEMFSLEYMLVRWWSTIAR
ncbi:hypothetical protein EUGRSUZ_L01128 [Eucalyptus grandis]|uniref:Uncharacterized protein n=1 Tax=Eucalyptus grandis TaxID=71139 RepID=A0A058ZTU1_EUCGR|nr:hypothetical protein EUGRSUZ_L01128 [Eucalyptus grandis]